MKFEEFKNLNENTDDLFDYVYLHIPSNSEWIPNGAGGLKILDMSSNVVLPIWLKENSKDWVKKNKTSV